MRTSPIFSRTVLDRQFARFEQAHRSFARHPVRAKCDLYWAVIFVYVDQTETDEEHVRR
jgi:hypothetical protein